MYEINSIAVANGLQLCPNEDEFFQAISKVDLTALESVISESPATAGQTYCETATVADHAGDDEISQAPQKNTRRGPKIKPAGPFVRLRLWCLYPGTEAPPRLGTLHNRLTKRGDDLAERCGFIGGVPDRKTIRERFQQSDLHPHLIEAALRAISTGFVQHYLMPPDPLPPPEHDERIRRSRTKECNNVRQRILRDGLGDEEFDDLIPRGSGADDFFLRHLHGGRITCHKCEPGDCIKGHDHGLTERPPRALKCPNPASHDGRCIHEVRREWRCRCCGSNVSLTSGIDGLDGTKIPLRKVLRCIHNMVNASYGGSALSMGGHLNSRARTSRHLTILHLMHRVREAMHETHPLPFKGPVEIDEAKFKLRDGAVHLIGAYDHATRRVYHEILDGPATQIVMRDFVERVSPPGSRVYTDGTAAWPPGIDRTHGVVIHCNFDFGHAEELYGEGNGWVYITTNGMEGKWGLLNRKLSITTAVSCKYFPLYLAEEMWRTNHIRNPLEAANYEGEERRGAALMGQIVANMGKRRLHPKELRKGVATNSNHTATGTVISHDSAAPDREPLDVVEMPLAA